MTPKVFIALPVYRDVDAFFMQSLLKLMLNRPCSLELEMQIGNPLLGVARNNFVARFLTTDCTHILFLDCDMVFEPSDLARLVEHNREVISGCCPKKTDSEEVDWAMESDGQNMEGDLLEVQNIGTAFLLIKREVFEEIIEASSDSLAYSLDAAAQMPGWDFFRIQTVDRRQLPEDFSFCRLLREHGFKIWADTRCVIGHRGAICFPTNSQRRLLTHGKALEAYASRSTVRNGDSVRSC